MIEYSKKCKKPIYQYTLEGEFIKKWDSASDIHRFYNFFIKGGTYKKGKRIWTINGFTWASRFYKKVKPFKSTRLKCPITVYSRITGEFINKYESITECKRGLNIPSANISNVLSGKISFCSGYIFKRYRKNYKLKIEPRYQKHGATVRVKVVDNNLNNFKIFKTAQETANYYGIGYHTINRKIKSKKPYTRKGLNLNFFKV